MTTVTLLVYLSFIFFFQAEDGIRDVAVTGVQTCALPIYGRFFSVAAIALQNAPGGASTMELEANEETSLVRLLAINDFALHGRSFIDRKSTRLNSSHGYISYAVFCLKKKNYTSRPTVCTR